MWSIRFLVQNGLYLYAAWSYIMFLITLDLALVYQFNVPKQTSHLIILILMCTKLILYFIVENFISYKHCKFVFTPWIIYGIFIYDSIINQSLIRRKLKIYEKSKPFFQSENLSSQQYLINENFSYFKINIYYFLHTSLLVIFVLLLLIKILKFIWKELCFHKNISI